MDFFKKYFGQPAAKVTWSQLEDMATKTWLTLDRLQTFGQFITAKILLFITKIPKGEKFDFHEHPDALESITPTVGKVLINSRKVLNVGETARFVKGYRHEVEALEDTELNVIFYKRD